MSANPRTWTEPELAELARELWTSELDVRGRQWRTVVDSAKKGDVESPDEIYVVAQGRIQVLEDGAWHEAGTFAHTLTAMEARDLVVTHDNVKMTSNETSPVEYDRRGQGFGAAWLAHNCERYIAADVKQIELYAMLDGAIAWAKLGFDTATGDDKRSLLARMVMLDDDEDPTPLPADQLDAWRSQLRAWAAGAELPTMQEIVSWRSPSGLAIGAQRLGLHTWDGVASPAQLGRFLAERSRPTVKPLDEVAALPPRASDPTQLER